MSQLTPFTPNRYIIKNYARALIPEKEPQFKEISEIVLEVDEAYIDEITERTVRATLSGSGAYRVRPEDIQETLIQSGVLKEEIELMYKEEFQKVVFIVLKTMTAVRKLVWIGSLRLLNGTCALASSLFGVCVPC